MTVKTTALVTAAAAALLVSTAGFAGPRDGGSVRFASRQSAGTVRAGPGQRERTGDRRDRTAAPDWRERSDRDPAPRRDDRPDRREERQERREDNQDRREDRQERHEDRRDDRWDHYYGHHHHVHLYYAPGYTVAVLPHGHVTVVVGGTPYWYYGGVYYRRAGTGYVVVVAPRGAYVGALPVGYYRVYVGPRTYYVYGGVYYLWEPERKVYVVSEPPPEVTLPALPEGAEVTRVNGKRYYKVAGVHYRPYFRGTQVVYRSTSL